jgi:hypothetical protein
MLAIRTMDRGAAFSTLRGIAGAASFPWGGKSFVGTGERGAGENRVHLLGRHRLFPFLTRVAPSQVDRAPCVVLDYDLPDNPWSIRQIHDEVREVEKGLWLGPAMWKGERGPALVLWFALDTREQARPIGGLRQETRIDAAARNSGRGSIACSRRAAAIIFTS